MVGPVARVTGRVESQTQRDADKRGRRRKEGGNVIMTCERWGGGG